VIALNFFQTYSVKYTLRRLRCRHVSCRDALTSQLVRRSVWIGIMPIFHPEVQYPKPAIPYRAWIVVVTGLPASRRYMLSTGSTFISGALLTRIIHQPEKSIKASTFDVRVAPSPAASQAHHEPKSSP